MGAPSEQKASCDVEGQGCFFLSAKQDCAHNVLDELRLMLALVSQVGPLSPSITQHDMPKPLVSYKISSHEQDVKEPLGLFLCSLRLLRLFIIPLIKKYILGNNTRSSSDVFIARESMLQAEYPDESPG